MYRIDIVPGVLGLTSFHVIAIRPREGAASLANASALRSICPGAHSPGHSLVMRTVTEAPLAARTDTYAPQALADS